MASSGRSPVWVYRFDWDEEGRVLWIDLSRLLGAAHALELPFVFGTLNLGPASDYVFPEETRPGARQLADRMMGYWGRFAHAGDPGGADAPAAWPVWPAGAGRYLIFDSEAGGGLRLSDETLTHDSVLAAIATDPRFESDAERCEIFGQLTRFGGGLGPAGYREIAGGICKDVPLPE
jgi:para-nitrobenzyl esterase